MWHIPLFFLIRPLIIAADCIIMQAKEKANTESNKTLKVYYFERKVTMKKAISILAAAMMMLTFTACGQTEAPGQTSTYQQSSTPTAANTSIYTAEPSEQNSKSEPAAQLNDNTPQLTDSPTQPADNPPQSTESLPASSPDEQGTSAEGKALIVYFSWSSSGNTEKWRTA